MKTRDLFLAGLLLSVSGFAVTPLMTSTSDSGSERSTFVVLYDQTDMATGNGVSDQDFGAAYAEYSCVGADDFVVTGGSPWDVGGVYTPGSSTFGSSDSVSVTFYDDAGGVPGAVVCAYPGVTSYTEEAGDLTITLPSDCMLAPGKYWYSQSVRQDFGAGQHFWETRLVAANDDAFWKNPGNGFGTGCVGWCRLKDIFPGQEDFLFRILDLVHGPLLTPVPSATQSAPGATIVACINYDPREISDPLGSYRADLTWDPTVLDYVSYSPGNPPPDSGYVNDSNADSEGWIRFNGVYTQGVSGPLLLLCVEFGVVGDVGSSSLLDLELDHLYAAGTAEDLLPLATAADSSVDTVLECTMGDVRYDGVIDTGDALVVLMYDAQISIPDPEWVEHIEAGCGDVDRDGDTDSNDANIILSFDVGLDTSGTFINQSNAWTDDCSFCGRGAGGSVATAALPGERIGVEVQALPDAVQPGELFEVSVLMDLSGSRKSLGSYTGQLRWRPEQVEYLGLLSGQTPGFGAPLANEEKAGEGLLRFTNAQPQGAVGTVELLRAQFRASEQFEDVSSRFSLDLGSAATTAPAFEDLIPLLGASHEAPRPAASKR